MHHAAGLAGAALGCDDQEPVSPIVDPDPGNLRDAGGLDAGISDAGLDAGSPDVQEVRLVAQWIETELDGVPVRLRSYNGIVPGPIITTRGGQSLRVVVVNELDDYVAQSWTKADTWNGEHNVPHHLSNTNLHVHGLDVRPHLFEPLGTTDPSASMISIEPGSEFHYQFEIPKDHPCGLFWYHPHHHGSTAVQAVSGMAGGIIVEGALDDVPEIAAAKSVVLVIQDIGLFRSDDPATPDIWTYEPVQNAIWNTFASSSADAVRIWDSETKAWVNQPNLNGGFTTGDYALRFYLANGQPFFREEHKSGCDEPEPDGGVTAPCSEQISEGLELVAAPGEVLRLRVLNACSDLVMPLYLEGHTIHLIALDGVNFETPRAMNTEETGNWNGVVDYSESSTALVVAPANRAEFLIQAAEPGVYRLIQLAHDGQQFLPAQQKTLLTLTVRGDAMEMALPTQLPKPDRYYPLIKDSELVDTSYKVPFSMMFPAELNPEVGVDFMVDEVLYDEHASGKVVTLGTAEQWTIQTVMTTEGHPFHIHVNHFEVMSINGLEQPPGTLMDTVWVPKPPSVDGGDPRTDVVIRSRFVEWTGKSVYHCHILPHEDTGMMQNFIILG
jgi:FtsP/CotA-like multicopper oxidase with cupredoxin domain